MADHASQSPSITLHFERERPTKNMNRFAERPAEGQEPLIRTLYIGKKWADGVERIAVTIAKVSSTADTRPAA